ncbi:F-box/kelch-repeat protein At4g39753 [Arabidopsis lyrata subsp. lyrata]|uniref:F-box/kelch-repeat protein At4g39753 n=1 Tax=Arabidopsis lyrata subsp. lyrata TaxID=81972 RepID=UPI000A29DA1C|nr:F-box/kelch-repeat protein At4g39753 [Arabidopsis lyrata subsp. lyrata]|eukprot:XP_020872234.1 F-box/kelch-repeat protein At4g39753 [Arabidopsis lyrata subsp. lyrata]
MITFWVETAASAATTSIAEPPSKKRKTNPSPPLPPPSFLSLPDVLILNCLSRIPKSYYPKLSIVSKTFRDLILSIDLNHARFHHKTQETFFHVCLKFPDRPLPSWYTLWIKPEGFDDKEEEKKKSTLVQVPSSYASHNPLLVVSVDSDVYAFKQCYPPSRVMYVRNKEVVLWRNAPNMTVARANPVAYVFDKKIYVMGGCAENESANWGEVFDPKTQTWESLPVPAPELRFSSMIRKLEMIQGKFYVRSNESKDSVYDPKNGKWNVAAKPLVSDSRCAVGDVWYSFRPNSCLWFDNEIQDWRLVKGLSSLNQSCRSGLIETVSYDGKLLLLWDKPTKPRRRVCGEKYICCALIAFEKRKNGQVWGKVEWSNVVLTVPSSYRFLRSTMIRT